MAEPQLSFDDRMAVIEMILIDLESTSREASTVDEAVDIFARGVAKVVARLRLEVDVARESRDMYRTKRDQLRDALTRKESARSLLPESDGVPSAASTPDYSSSARSEVPVQYAALACLPELLDDDPPALAAPFRRSAAPVQRSGQPLSPRLQPAPVPSKPSRANKAEIRPPIAPAPVVANSPPVKPTKAAKQNLRPTPAPAAAKAAGRAVAQHYQEIILPETAAGPSQYPYVELGLFEVEPDLPSKTLEYGGFEEQQSEFGEFPVDAEE